MAWFSLRVQEVLSSILGILHITNIEERCLIFVGQNVIGYSKATEFDCRTTRLSLHRREVFQFDLWNRDSFTNVKVIIALTREFSVATEFSICVQEIQSSILRMQFSICVQEIQSLILRMRKFTSFHESCWSYVWQRDSFTDFLTWIHSTRGV